MTLSFYYSSNTHSAQRLILIAATRPYFDYVTGFLTAFDGRANPLDAELVVIQDLEHDLKWTIRCYTLAGES
jgi:hypothetical protein